MAGSEEMNTSPHVQSPLLNAQRGGIAARSLLWPALSVIVGAVFIYAGVLKAWNPFSFADDIEHFRILSWPLGIRLAFYLPWLEILCGLGLIVGWLRSGATAILTGLMVVFIGATIAAKARGLNLDCGCFGSVGKGLSFTSHLLIDFALLASLLVLWFRNAKAGGDQPNS